VESLVHWSVAIAAIAAVAGGLLTHDVRFFLTCAAVSLADLWLFSYLAHHGRSLIEAGSQMSSGMLAAAIGLRLVLKAAALVLAAVLPNVLSFWGAVTGALVVDTTVLVIGGAAAAIRAFGTPGPLDGGR
jgi:hypothetical protein